MARVLLSVILVFFFSFAAVADPLFRDQLVLGLAAEYERQCSSTCTLTIDDGKFDFSVIKLSSTGDTGVLVVDRGGQAGSAGYPRFIMLKENGKWRKIEESFDVIPLHTTTNRFFDLQGKSFKLVWNGREYVDEASYLEARNVKPSFDCSKATTKAAQLICSDADLSRLDAQLGKLFHEGYAARTGPDQTSFRNEEVNWIRDRNKECGLGSNSAEANNALPEQKACMLEALKKRIAVLSETSLHPHSAQSASNTAERGVQEASKPNRPPGLNTGTSNENISLPAINVDCGQITFTPDGQRNIISVALNVSSNKSAVNDISAEELSNNEAVGRVLAAVERLIRRQCGDPLPPHGYLLDSRDPRDRPRLMSVELQPAPGIAGYEISAKKDQGQQNWSIERRPNVLLQSRLAAAEAQTRLNDQQQMRVSFTSRFGVEDFVEPGRLLKNPFLYKGKVIATLVHFRQMVAENAALFDMGEGGALVPRSAPILYVTGIPSVTSSGQVVLALKITGVQKEFTIPEASFVGAHWCVQPGCGEMDIQ